MNNHFLTYQNQYFNKKNELSISRFHEIISLSILQIYVMLIIRKIQVDTGEAKLMLVMLMAIHVVAKPCIFTSPLTLQLLLEYAEWRSWDQVVFFDNVSPFSEYSQFIN